MDKKKSQHLLNSLHIYCRLIDLGFSKKSAKKYAGYTRNILLTNCISKRRIELTSEEVIELYIKERTYEKLVFGEYNSNKSLNLASFLTFLEQYLKRAKKSYCNKWTSDLPAWLVTCKEEQEQGTAPVESYEDLIKIMALAGAALESYTNIDVDEWRPDGSIKEKWIDEL